GGALRLFGRYMYETLLDSALRESPPPALSARLRAVAEDLRFSAKVLAALGAARREADLTPEDVSLSLKAGSWAREVLELARAMDGAAGGAGEPR
ncbi:MAG TPA: hypothetical protein VLF66_11670, partial [Thermoanaerobaculia bacterium]|nr:hypothetical protein [Thermoanaerobaculia bacterium]